MATSRGFQLGLLPERKINRRALATSYGFVTLIVIILICLGYLVPDQLQIRQYPVTAIIPLPSAKPPPEPIKKPQIKAKLLPAVKLPVFQTPKLVVPREVRREAPKPEEAPKVVVNQFQAPQLKMTAGGARPPPGHTGNFGGSSQTPTANAPLQKMHEGGVGEPKQLRGA